MSSNKMTKMFYLIMVINMMAMIPFDFAPTAHMSINFYLSLTLWLSSMMYGWKNNYSHMMTHMTPLGTPTNLMNFMVLIEMVSNLIRPITLSVRLTANMVAGHLLISLLSNFSLSSSINMNMSFVIMMTLALLEMMVAMVQAYVLVTLTTLYQNESMK